MRSPFELIGRLAALALLALCFVALFVPPPARAADRWPALAGGSCGVVSHVPMPGTDAVLIYWRCPDGAEVSFHVRKAWLPETDTADGPKAAYRLQLQALRARSHDRVAQLRVDLLGLRARAQCLELQPIGSLRSVGRVRLG